MARGLAHPHEHDIGQSLRLTERSLDEYDLFNDLRGCEISLESPLPRQAEPATHGATRLRRYADGEMVPFRDENRFDQMAVVESKKVFAGAVLRD